MKHRNYAHVACWATVAINKPRAVVLLWRVLDSASGPPSVYSMVRLLDDFPCSIQYFLHVRVSQCFSDGWNASTLVWASSYPHFPGPSVSTLSPPLVSLSLVYPCLSIILVKLLMFEIWQFTPQNLRTVIWSSTSGLTTCI